ncbi:MAG: hypothetical protein ILO68_01695 [Clostridia bacterium]|nr:hypothetical protein [Clostridia bacterium]
MKGSFVRARSVRAVLCLLLAALLLFAAAACETVPEESETSGPAVSGQESAEPASQAEPDSQAEPISEAEPTSEPEPNSEAEPVSEAEPAESPAESEPEPSEDVSQDGGDPSSESSEPTDEPDVIPEFISNFVSFGAANTNVRATSESSVRLTGVNTDPVYGGVILYTHEYGAKLSTSAFKDYSFFCYEYNPEHFVYEIRVSYEDKIPKSVEIPDDGFLIAVHKDQPEMLARLKNADPNSPVYPHGVQACPDIQYKVKKASGITIDGVFSESEWKDYLIEEVNSDNPSWSYAQFEKDNYYAKAKYYEAYDEDYFYLCVVVSSAYHYCPVTQENANGMWQYECIQVKFSSESPDSEYILTHYDHVVDNTANNDGIVRAYGFAVNDEGDTCYYENSPKNKVFGGLAACSRSDEEQKTVYEVAIPFAEYGLKGKKGMKIGVTFSINSTNADDISKGAWKNITYRDGGGVIGRNDWAKIPVITLN